jgi:hypothetical protein
MFSFLAWPRVFYLTLILSRLTRNTYAREESLCEYSFLLGSKRLTDIFPVTSSVSYCNPPETLLIQRFEVAYFPSNTSVSFNVSVSSVVRFHVSKYAAAAANVIFRSPTSMSLPTFSSMFTG